MPTNNTPIADAPFRVTRYRIEKLWDDQDVDIRFYDDVNIIIGPNGIGKTSILSTLWAVLSGDFLSLYKYKFAAIEVHLASVAKPHVTIKTTIDLTPKGLTIRVGETLYNLPKFEFPPEAPSHLRRHMMRDMIATQTDLPKLVNSIWLPVARRMPATDDDEPYGHRNPPIESVDHRLKDLATQLIRYHSQLNAKLSELHKGFERDVIMLVLYTENDRRQLSDLLPDELSTNDQSRLLYAFQEAGLMTPTIQQRITKHFDLARDVVRRLRNLNLTHDDPNDLHLDVMAIPLINRTKAMIDRARQLDGDRSNLLRPIRDFESTIRNYISSKLISVQTDGRIKIETLKSRRELQIENLSSGEKQILILLIQALINNGLPVTYLADEPELSLHVDWQEQLLPSLRALGGPVQVIVATHSPDIVGPYKRRIINLGSSGANRDFLR